MIRYCKYCLFIFFLLGFLRGEAQGRGNKGTLRVGVFAPLQLDSVFTKNSFRYESGKFPRFIVPSLDFVQGALIAMDSMPGLQHTIRATVYDTKSTQLPIDSLSAKGVFDSLDLIIGSVRDEDYTQLAQLARQKQIPFISVSFPNDGGVTDNPFVVILNSTLKTHCEAIFAHVLQENPGANIVLCRKPGAQEDRVAKYFRQINAPDQTELLGIKTCNITDSNYTAIKYKLDSTRKNVVIVASLDENFAGTLFNTVAGMQKLYPVKMIGMPNWSGFKLTGKGKGAKGMPVYFTTAFHNDKTDAYSKRIKEIYLERYKGVPTDNTFKGFEVMMRFVKILDAHPNDFMSYINDRGYDLFMEYNFKPVYNNGATLPDYFENKKIIFLKSENGAVRPAFDSPSTHPSASSATPASTPLK